MFIFAPQTPTLLTPDPFPWDGSVTWHGSSGADLVYDDDQQDSLYGGSGDDIIRGGKGSDTLFDDPGDDLMAGGIGNDTIFGHDGADFATEGGGNDTPGHGSGDDNIKGGKGSDTLFDDPGDDLMAGGIGNDTIFGHEGADFATDGAGYDALGHGGDDIIRGGKGSDTPFHSLEDDPLAGDADGSHDKAVGFEDGPGGDRLDLSDLLTGGEPLADALPLVSDQGDTQPPIAAHGGGDLGEPDLAVEILGVGWSGSELADPIADDTQIVA